MAAQLKSNFAIESKHDAYYKGGKVQFSKDGSQMFCQCGRTVRIMDIGTGQEKATIGQEEDDVVTSFALSPDEQVLVVASQNLLLKQWDWKEKTVNRTWKAVHSGPISYMTFDPTSTLLATGSSDSTVKVWDVIHQYFTHSLRGHTGVISVVAFHPDIDRLQLVSAAEDYKVRVWNLQSSTCVAILETHYSVITAFQFSPDGSTLYTGGRDNIVAIWHTDKWTKTHTIPVFESLEDLVLLPDKKNPHLNITTCGPHFITAGNKGLLRVWNATTGQCVYTQTGGSTGDSASTKEGANTKANPPITSATYNKTLGTINVITFDHYIIMYNLDDLSVYKEFVGFNDDILAAVFLHPTESHLAVATNSDLIKVFEMATWSLQLLRGHTDIVLSLSVSRCKTLLASGAKDNSVRVWKMDPDTLTMNCIAVAKGHTHAVNTVAFSILRSSFIVTASEDCTVKLWPLPETLGGGTVVTLLSSVTEHAHEKDINSVIVAPNDKLVASGSQDHTAKLWTADKLSLLGVFRGHKSSIWAVQFSTVDQCLATASADSTIKIWALSDYSCVKTFEGHTSSVIQVKFLTRGMQLLSSGADGLLKLWTIKTNECIGTWDEHEAKVWAMAVTDKEDRVVTGAGDSTLYVWKDVTEEEQVEARKQQEDFLLREQELLNLLQARKFLKAIVLAITLNQPFRVLSIMKDVLAEETGAEEMRNTLEKLRQDQLGSVLQFASQWNTNSKNCHAAQFVLNVALTTYPPEQLVEMAGMKTTLEALLPYTERHFQRMNRLQHSSTFVDYTWQCMRLSVTEQPEMSKMDTDVPSSTRQRGVPPGGSSDEDGSWEADSSDDEADNNNTKTKDLNQNRNTKNSLLLSDKKNESLTTVGRRKGSQKSTPKPAKKSQLRIKTPDKRSPAKRKKTEA